MTDQPRPLKVFPSTGSGHRLCHAHADSAPVRALYTRLTKDGVDAWLDEEKPCGERSRTILPGQGFDMLNLPDWELETRKA